jgi:hypothetical protein
VRGDLELAREVNKAMQSDMKKKAAEDVTTVERKRQHAEVERLKGLL